jgi:hypothetical protein
MSQMAGGDREKFLGSIPSSGFISNQLSQDYSCSPPTQLYLVKVLHLLSLSDCLSLLIRVGKAFKWQVTSLISLLRYTVIEMITFTFNCLHMTLRPPLPLSFSAGFRPRKVPCMSLLFIKHGRMTRGGHGLLKVSLGPFMSDPFTPCGHTFPETALQPFQELTTHMAGGL